MNEAEKLTPDATKLSSRYSRVFIIINAPDECKRLGRVIVFAMNCYLIYNFCRKD